jgi:hypothetical protein
MPQIFISYSRRNADKVYPIVSILEEAGFDIWIDKDDIPIGKQWPEKIVQGIKSSDYYLIFISPASVNSDNVTNELTLAYEEKLKRGLEILPVILTQTELPEKIQFQLAGINWIDISKNIRGGLEKLFRALDNKTLPKNYKKYLLNYLPGLFVTPELIAPSEDTSGEVVVGKTITIQQIRDRRFFLRKNRLEECNANFDTLIKEKQETDEPLIYTFWIHGRSGSGKSVLLLQFMQKIILERNAIVFWLDDASEDLQLFLEKWAENYVDLDEFVYIFIDDFNAPRKRDLIDYSPIARLLRNPKYADIKLPILVTCSPPEYQDEFQVSGSDEGFRIKKWLIPPVSKNEQKDFLNWFKDRTGESPKAGEAFEQSEGLILSMMFELRYGDMKEFGRRFKERLEGSGLLEVMAQPFALNRLYIWPPKSWIDEFSAAQKDALAALNQDQDFSIMDSETQTGKYIRLTHPHLSDVIYKAMRADSGGFQRAEDLAKAFERALLSDDILASRILRAIADFGERIKEINPGELAKKITGAWIEQSTTVKQFTYISLTFFWVSWSRWASRDSQITSLLTVSPVDKAIECLVGPHRFWGILWESIWADKPGYPKLVEVAVDWLDHPSNQDDSSWAHVWRTLAENVSLLPEGTSPAELTQTGLDWLSAREDRPEWAHVWRTLAENVSLLPEGTSPAELTQTGLDWLSAREDRPEWSHVWRTLVENVSLLPEGTSPAELTQTGLHWLSTREDRPEWSHVWETLLRNVSLLPEGTSPAELTQTGLDWLSTREDRPEWSHVWRTLAENVSLLPEGTSPAELTQTGLDWLSAREDRPEWSHVWRTLVENVSLLPEGTSPAELTQTGLHWLSTREDRPEWSHVWETLLRNVSLLPEGTSPAELTQTGLDWLSTREDRPEWSHVWETLLRNVSLLPEGTSPAELTQTGLDWLSAREDREDWYFIWRTLVENVSLLPEGTSPAELTQTGLHWLSIREDRPEWAHVWETLLRNVSLLPEGTSPAELTQTGLDWLSTREDRPEWAHVWETLLRNVSLLPEGTSPAELTQTGLDWLSTREDRPEWAHVWRTLAENVSLLPEGTSPAELTQTGLDWLSTREDRPEWSHVWRTLVENVSLLPEGTSPAELTQTGLDWLSTREDRPEWAHVWRTLAENVSLLPEGTSPAELTQTGLHWLSTRDDRPEWNYVWRTLVENASLLPEGTSPAELTQTGLDWLSTREDREGWSFVWQTLLRISVQATQAGIFQLGLNWLQGHKNLADWAFIWEDLLKQKELDENTRNNLLELGIEWLPGREYHASWSFIFEHCLRHGVIEKEFLTMGIEWIFHNGDRPETPQLAFQIAEYHNLLSPTSRRIFTAWASNWVKKSNSNHRQWHYKWATYWELMPTIETINLALKWIEVYPNRIKEGKWIIQFLLWTVRVDAAKKINEWHHNNLNHPISEFAREELIKTGVAY